MNPTSRSNATIYVVVQFAAITASIGPDQQAGTGNNVTISGSAYDPDNTLDASGAPYPFVYVWSLTGCPAYFQARTPPHTHTHFFVMVLFLSSSPLTSLLPFSPVTTSNYFYIHT